MMADEYPKYHLPPFDEYPIEVRLRFRTEKDRKEFIGGLSDGFGENFCQLDWEWMATARGEPVSISATEAAVLAVDVFEPREDE